ncbi:hypothetical protein [Corynebacterium faecale]|uniref:hypothetical protein n=1 Tax=Corynebacterium faecale TaxID=1758466 RepID=UPI00338DF7E2
MGWCQVYNRLTASLPHPLIPPAASSISQAMRRVGPAPLRNLFDLLSGPAITRNESIDRFAGRLVVAVDGTQIPVADTDANHMMFPKPRAGANGQAGYPRSVSWRWSLQAPEVSSTQCTVQTGSVNWPIPTS